MASRIDQLLTSSPQPERAEALYRLFGEVAHLWNYADGNRRHFQDHRVDNLARAVLDNPGLADRASQWLSSMATTDGACWKRRQRWTTWFSECSIRVAWEAEEREFAGAVDKLQHHVRSDRIALLDRLGARSDAEPELAFFRLTATLSPCDRRTKLAKIWASPWQRHLPALMNCIDARVDRRRAHAHRSGFASVWDQSFQNADITADCVRTFIDSVVARAAAAHTKFEAEIAKLAHCDTRALDHFGWFLQSCSGQGPTPLLPIDECLALLTTLTSRAFRVSLEREVQCAGAARYAVRSQQGTLGFIMVDLLDESGPPGEPLPIDAAPTKGPTGRVLCRLRRNAIRTGIPFDALHSLFHEFGHALDHVLFSNRHPSSSGLDLVPLHRSEELSGWFEKWVFHPGLAAALQLSGPAAEQLRVSQRIKKLESLRSLLDLAVLAQIDFQLHSSDTISMQQAMDEALAAIGLDEGFDSARPLVELAHPLMRAHPGAAFIFLWGACAGAEAFASIEDVAMADTLPPGKASFPRFTFHSLARPPSVHVLFDLYEMALPGGAGT